MAQALTKTSPFVFIIERTFNTPRERVWKAWTDAEQMKQWFGPKGCIMPHCSMDLRPGGTMRYGMEFEGSAMWGRWIYQEIKAPEKLVAIISFTDPSGETIVEHPHSPGWPLEIWSVVTFTDLGGKTRIRIEWTDHNASAAEKKTFEEGAPSMQQGWGGCLDQFEEYLAGR